MVEPPVWQVDADRAFRIRPSSSVTLGLCSAIGLIAYLWPFFTAPAQSAEAGGAAMFSAHAADSTLLMVVLLPLMLLVLGAEIAGQRINSRAIALLGVMCAAGAVLRIPGGGLSGFSPMFFLVILAGFVFGPGFGFVMGALTMFVSALITAGIGPWLPFQIFGLAWVGAGAGAIGSIGALRDKRSAGSDRLALTALAVYGCAVGFAFGALLNLWFWPFASSPGAATAYDPAASPATNLVNYARFYALTSFGWDLMRAVGNVAMTLLLGMPLLRSLRRAGRRANLR
jgi:energy-coupling factor transport system substrate-specific component